MAQLYVNDSTGNDSNSYAQAQSPSTPWKSITKAAGSLIQGDDVEVAAGTYNDVGEYVIDKGATWVGIGTVIWTSDDTTYVTRISNNLAAGQTVSFTNITIDAGTTAASALEISTSTNARAINFTDMIFLGGTTRAFYHVAAADTVNHTRSIFTNLNNTASLVYAFGAAIGSAATPLIATLIDCVFTGTRFGAGSSKRAISSSAGDDRNANCVWIFDGCSFDIESDVESACVRFHHWPSVTIRNSPKIKAVGADDTVAIEFDDCGIIVVEDCEGIEGFTTSGTCNGLLVSATNTSFTTSATIRNIDVRSESTASAARAISVDRITTVSITDIDDVYAVSPSLTSAYVVSVIGSVATDRAFTATLDNLDINSDIPTGYGLRVGDFDNDNGVSTATLSNITVTGRRPDLLSGGEVPHNIVFGQNVGITTSNITSIWAYVGLMHSRCGPTRFPVTTGVTLKDHKGPYFYAKGNTAGEFTGNTLYNSGAYPQTANAMMSCVVQGGDNNTVTLMQDNNLWVADMASVQNLSEYGPSQIGTWLTNNYFLPNDVGIDPDDSTTASFGTSSVVNDNADITEWLDDGFTTNENVDFTTFSAAQILAEINSTGSSPTLTTYDNQEFTLNDTINIGVSSNWTNVDPNSFTSPDMPIGLSLSATGTITGPIRVGGIIGCNIHVVGLNGQKLSAGFTWYERL